MSELVEPSLPEKAKHKSGEQKLAEELGFVKDEKNSQNWFRIYTKAIDGKQVTLSFQNSRLQPGGVRVMVGIWSDIEKNKPDKEYNLCQDESFAEKRKQFGLIPRESDRFFEGTSLKKDKYQKLFEFLNELDNSGFYSQ